MKWLLDALKVSALLGTMLLLMATPQTPCQSEHPELSARYAVAGDCGTEAVVRVFSGQNMCEVFLDPESGAPGLPVSGRLSGTTDIRQGGWNLSGAVPTADTLDGGAADAHIPMDDAGSAESSPRQQILTRSCVAERVDERTLTLTCNGSQSIGAQSDAAAAPSPGFCVASLVEIE